MRTRHIVVMSLILGALFLILCMQQAMAQDTTQSSATEVKPSEQAPPPEPPADEPGRRDERPRWREGERGQRGQFDPAQMMTRMLERYKEDLDSTDEEWKVIEPLLKKTLEARMQSQMGGFFRRGGPSATPDPEVEALSKALESKDTPSDEIKTKLSAYRDARKKKEETLQKAREELRKVLTVRQEAQMVLTGVLD